MAKKTNVKANTKVEETTPKVEETTTVSGTTNNVGQEIAPIQPSDVISCTMTEDEHKERKERIFNKMEQGLRLSWDIMVDITSAKERKEQTLDGYEETEEAFNQWCDDTFGMKSTQVKQAVRVLTTYGKVDDKGEWSLEDKYKRYTKEKLDIIQRHPQFKTKVDFDAIVEACGITPATSEKALKELVREAKGLPAPQPKTKTNTTPKSEEAKTEPTTEAIKSSEVYKHVEDTRDVVMKFASDMLVEANKVFESKDDKLAMVFVTRFIEAFKDMENEYNNVGKETEEVPQTEEAPQTDSN